MQLITGWLGQPVPGEQSADLAADRLSGLFLAVAFGAALPTSVAFASWAARPESVIRRGLGTGHALALGAVAVIVDGRDAFTVLFGWETLTIGFYLLAGSDRARRGRAADAQLTFAFGRLSGAALLAGLLLLAAKSQLDHARVVHARARRRRPDHGPGAAADRVRDQGGPGAVPDLAAARLRGGPRSGPRDHGRGVRQRRLLRHVAHAGHPGPPARLAGGPAAAGRGVLGAARHRARGGAEPAEPGHRLLQCGEQRPDRGGLRRRADRCRGRRRAPGRGRAAGRHAADGRAHRGQVAAVHLGRRDRDAVGQRRPGGAARPAQAGALERGRLARWDR